ncbi:MAG: ydaO [Myxococcales bacterium]|nr:ydaO [Myxococcales bacterium]
MGLDGLGSSAYGPEAALTVLTPLGVAALSYIVPITLSIVALLAILFASYWQTIKAYPNNGGGYAVSKANLGVQPSLLAASALMVDYVLTVAVGISAGMAAFVSAVPALHPYTLELCLGALLLITIVNLRGTIDAGRLFALPTYVFIASFGVLLAIGVHHAIVSGGHPQPVVAPPPLPKTTEAVGVWLLLRAFASGCTAMTGVEAVSNGVSAFKQPVVKHAHRTLTVIVVVLGLLLAGIAYLTRAYGILAMDQQRSGYQSVLSQLAGAVVGHGLYYYVAIGSLLCVLALSANTSFVDFPRLCRLLASDGFLPRPFAIVGRRLVFSVGITYLAVTTGLLLLAFGGITDRLIPLFAVGAFMTFTLSQLGMVVHWKRTLSSAAETRARAATWFHLFINALGALSTAVALIVIIAAKLTEGAWITLLVIPAMVVLMRSIKRYYTHLDARLYDDSTLQLTKAEPPIVLVAEESWSKLTDRALSFALQLSPDVIGVHLITQDDDADAIKDNWARHVEGPAARAGMKPPKLVLLRSEYRLMYEPLLKLIEELEQQFPSRQIAVLLPELVKTHWWQVLLHTHRARHLRTELLRFGGSRLVIIIVPCYVEEPRPSEAALEEPPVTPVE